jgi:tetratricopeptide (TPR) repeat protein
MIHWQFWRLAGSLLTVGAVLSATPAFGYSYGPASDAEWAGWPEFCKVRFTVSGEGSGSQRGGTYPPEVAAQWQGKFGECWGLLHHHCGALLQLQRAKGAVSPQARRFALDSAVQEDNFALNNCPATNPFYSVIVTHMGLTFTEAGAQVKAMEQFNRAISANPTYAGAYVAKASLLKRQGSASAALDVLIKGSEATKGESPELENSLGLAYFDAKQFEKAREHARLAYSLGFPLPALRDKLARAGYPL